MHGSVTTLRPLVIALGLAVLAQGSQALAEAGCVDNDGDLYGQGCGLGKDCDDSDGAVSPAGVETCDGRDNDCNGRVDDASGCEAEAVDTDARVQVPGGQFTIGSEVGLGHQDEWPPHPVALEGFELDRTEVTNADYRACVEAGICSEPQSSGSATREDYFTDSSFDAYPVIHVSHGQARRFCAYQGGRLPTEAEWEAAARGQGEPRTYPWGDQEPDCTLANFGGPGGCSGDTDEVGRRPDGASPHGALDMAGNVWEWTSDWYDPMYYGGSPTEAPRGPAAGSHRVIRGGCWESGVDSLRVTCRNAALPRSAQRNIGFRCVYNR